MSVRLPLFTLLSGALLFSACHSLQSTPASQQPEQSIVILFDNDVHCNIAGYPYIAGLRDVISDTAHVALVSSGDYLQGGLTGALTRGEYIIDAMKAVGYDAVTLGNHEFDYGIVQMRQLLNRLGSPVTCVNLFDAAGDRVYAPYIIRQFGNRRVAIIGATTPTALETEAYSFYDEDDVQLYDLVPNKVYELIQQSVDEVRQQGVDYVILITHLGEDPNAMDVDSRGLIQKTTGIDVVLDGHTHSVIPYQTVLNRDGKPVLTSQTGTKFENIGKLVIMPDGRMSIQHVPADQYPAPNAAVKHLTDSLTAELDKIVSRPVCQSDVKLVILDEKGNQAVRYSETNAGDLVADAYRVITGADFAMTNGGGIRTELEAGALTYGNMVDLLPYDSYLSVVEITGAQLIDLLSAVTADVPVENGDFPQVSGLNFTVNVANAGKPGHITDVTIRNRMSGKYEPVDLQKAYQLATIDYCITGGGFKGMLKKNTILLPNTIIYNEALIKYVMEHLQSHITTDYAQPQGRIKIIYPEP